jgi:hypothetical protein
VVSKKVTPFCFLCISPTRSGYRELSLELVSLEDNHSLQPKWPPMEEEKRDGGEEYLIKLFLMESLAQQRNEMLDNVYQILQRLSTIICKSSSSSGFGDSTPFKVQVNFYIPIFEVHINADALEKWLNLLEGYFSIHNFSDREKLTFALFNSFPHVKHWWETYWEKNSTEECGIFGVEPTWDFFMDAFKEKYFLVRNYDDEYMRWTMLHQKRDQTVLYFTNTFHTFHTKLGIKESKKHLVLKYRGALHRYIQYEMDFMAISSLGSAYRYVVKIEKKFKQHNK